MITALLKKVFGSRNERLIKKYSQAVRAINALESQTEKLTDAELRAKTDEFRIRIRDRLAKVPDAAGNDAEGAVEPEARRNGVRREMLEELLPEAFAVV